MSSNIVRIQAAFTEVIKRLLPAVMDQTDANATLIRNYIVKRNLTLESADNIEEAVRYLDRLELITWKIQPVEPAPPAPLTKAEQEKALRERTERLVAKDLADQIRADGENRKDPREKLAEVKQREEALKAKTAAQTAQEQAKQFVDQKIFQWTVNGGPGKIDFTQSEQGQALLRNIRITHDGGKTIDWVTSKRVLLDVFNSETVGQLRVAIPAAIARLNEKPVVNQKASEDARRGAGLGNMPNYSR